MGSSGRPLQRTLMASNIFPTSVGPFSQNEELVVSLSDEAEDGSEGGYGIRCDGLRLGKAYTPEQIWVLEKAFKESPHPDETQRQQLSEQLGLSASQVKFWFQNRRSQIKTNQERHESSLLRPGLEKLRSRKSLYDHFDVVHDDKTKLQGLAGRALDELTTMCSSGAPLWVRSVQTGRDVLNYDEYVRLFRHRDDDSSDRRAVWSVEASRETAVVCCNATQLVGAFVDVNQWKEMFPSMITKASTMEVVHAGENDHHDGILQLMFAEVQTLTPLVPTRELFFLRHCKKLGTDKWAVVDVSLDDFEPGAQTLCTLTPCTCLKKPSGCIVEEQSSGRHCKVTWVEHARCCEDDTVPLMCRMVTASGRAFGARRWVAALRLQCERMVVFSAPTNIPTGSSNGVSGKQSVLKLAQRMTSSLYRVIGASRERAWIKASNNDGTRDIRRTSRRSTGEHGEPLGLIACVVLSEWLPVNPAAVFGLLLDESRRHEWDLLLPGPVQRYVALRTGNDRGNCITAYATKSSAEELRSKLFIQDSRTSPCAATVAYGPVDAAVLRSLVGGRDSSAVPVLPFGFVVTPAAITSRTGSLLTLAFQALASSAAATDAALPADAVKDVTRLAFCTLGRIKKALRCGDR